MKNVQQENGMPNKIDIAHMNAAEGYAKLSYAKRLKVGAIITKDDRVISIGYNGTPAGWDNNCEDVIRETFTYVIDKGGEEYEGANISLKTKPEVIHAESNAIGKLARSSESGEGASMYITHAPCFDCAKLIHVAGIKKVFYREAYRSTEGIEFLNKSNIEVEKI
jgi:dCMP deaminase